MKIKDLVNKRGITHFRLVRPDKTFIDVVTPWHMGFRRTTNNLIDNDLNLTVGFITALDVDDNNIFLIGDNDRDLIPAHFLFDPIHDPKWIIFTV